MQMNGDSSVAGHLAFNAAERVVAKCVLRRDAVAARQEVGELRGSRSWHSNCHIADNELARGMQRDFVNWYEHRAFSAQLRDVRHAVG